MTFNLLLDVRLPSAQILTHKIMNSYAEISELREGFFFPFLLSNSNRHLSSLDVKLLDFFSMFYLIACVHLTCPVNLAL